MKLKFYCTNCGQPIVTQFLKMGETAICRSCRSETIVPQDAQETDENLNLDQPKKAEQIYNYRPVKTDNHLPTTCSKCGNNLQPDDNFCRKCGTTVRQAIDGIEEQDLNGIQSLPTIYYALIQVSCAVVFISFFLPWVFSASGWDIMNSGLSWHFLLAATPPIAAIGVSIIIKMLYSDPYKIKTYILAIEIVSSLPLIAFIILAFAMIGAFRSADFGSILKSIPDLVKLIEIGGWGTVLGLVAIDALTAALYKEGLRLLGEEDDSEEDGGLLGQIQHLLPMKNENSNQISKVTEDHVNRVRNEINREIPENPTKCIICEEKFSDKWRKTKKCRKTGLCPDCLLSYLSRLKY